MFKMWSKFALQYPKIWTISNDSVFFEDKQPTQAVLKQNYTNRLSGEESPEALFAE